MNEIQNQQAIDLQDFQKAVAALPPAQRSGVLRALTEDAPVVPRVEFISATEVGFLYKENLITEDEARSFVGLKPKVKQ